jgi:hypothetical protein
MVVTIPVSIQLACGRPVYSTPVKAREKQTERRGTGPARRGRVGPAAEHRDQQQQDRPGRAGEEGPAVLGRRQSPHRRAEHEAEHRRGPEPAQRDEQGRPRDQRHRRPRRPGRQRAQPGRERAEQCTAAQEDHPGARVPGRLAEVDEPAAEAGDDPENEMAEPETHEERPGQREPAADAQGETEPAAVLARQVDGEKRAGPSGAPVRRVLGHAHHCRYRQVNLQGDLASLTCKRNLQARLPDGTLSV